ncbi:AsnC family transcriptional regulator [Leptobacterium flavescens]|uniref:AsnC family transcriptional regulator n=1 Tax=Leptobacterium flavescens TaxID=472055 RepID=A0A6P0UMK6_9FLAO|nr:Lrp/AsnC family transcriptional regulator [Leptobacterium flavescens]NER13690.1 AsnC family transcriptional regulator [Leptobacterium flavescens]
MESALDKTDLKIIELLRNNARYSFADLGRKISLSPSAVRERVQRLEDEGIIRKYKTLFDREKLGYGLEAIVMLKLFSGKLQAFMTAVDQFPEIMECYRVTGPQNIHMKVVLKDQRHLQNFIDRLIIYGDTTTHLILSDLVENEHIEKPLSG